MLNLLSKLPLVSTGLNFITGKTRLFIEYVLIAILICTAAVSFSLWVNKNRVELKLASTKNSLFEMSSKMMAIEAVNVQQEQVIANLNDLRAKDNEALNTLISEYQQLAKNDARIKNKLLNLENNDAMVKNFLNTPLPDNLACLLNKTCDGEGSPNPAANGINEALPTAAGRPDKNHKGRD